MGPDSFLEWLYSLQVHGIKLGLANITELLRRCGDPQDSFKSVHVAGSDGKGSVCACIYSILCASGFSVASYSSPHLVRFNERIVVDGEEIPDDELSRLASILVPIVKEMDSEGMKCTFFEVTTAIAFMYFKEKGVDYAVIETGMGGRFDATNVLVPEVSVICNISLEHTEYLGDTIEKIAFEKAGIIKSGVPCVTLNEDRSFNVIESVAKEKQSPLTRVLSEDIEVVSNRRDSLLFTYKEEEYEVSLPGRMQANNASLAIEAVARLDVFGQCVRCKMRKGLLNARNPCRMERMKDLPIVVDVTHTAAGSERLAADIKEMYGSVLLVYGSLKDKDIPHIMRNLSAVADKVIITSPESERAASVEEVLEKSSGIIKEPIIAGNVSDAMDEAMSIRKEDQIILVTGSFYMAGEVLEWQKRTCARY